MADPQKIVQVPDVGIVAFPANMPDSHVASIIKTHLSKSPAAKDFTSNTNGEGLYRMSNSQSVGAWDTSKEAKVPFSKVEDAIKAGYKLHFDDAPRYQKDLPVKAKDRLYGRGQKQGYRTL